MKRLFWPLLWLLGFRMWKEGDAVGLKVPNWWPNKQRLADDLETRTGRRVNRR